ncbi:glycosyltransferase family 2 protein [Clostridiales bacterium TF09-2AC]|nr:glycosyltransferase family 2 protein [Clostridiales bacterium TF09-2AC]
MTQNNPLISIIMPVYKVENYVGKAIESILKQTLMDFEFLIVNDGSPDRSGEICDEYAKTDSRIKVIHKENGGAPSARNMAIDIAQGKYLYFLDSDDWTEPTMLQDMYELAEKHDSQLVIAGFYIDTYYSDTEYMTIDYIPQNAIYRTKDEFRKDAYKLFDKNMLYPPWNKLYLASWIKQQQLYFPTTLWDDFPFNLSVIRNINQVVITSKQYYHFLRARAESETAKYIPTMYEKREEEHGWLLELYEYWDIFDTASQEMMARRYIERLIGCFENLTNPNCNLSFKEKRNQVRKMLYAERTRISLEKMLPKSLYMKGMIIPLKMENTILTLLEAKVITLVKTNNTKLFATLKARR